MFIWWGPELIQFYNDAYRQTMGPERHPSALGDRGRECWAEIWPIIGPQIDRVMRGDGATWNEDQLVPVTRFGGLQQVWWTYGYSPIDDDDGVGGVLVVCNDVTEQHLAREALAEANNQLLGDATRLRDLFGQAPGFIAVLRGSDHRFEFLNSAYARLVQKTDILGHTVLEVLPEVVGQGFIELLDAVYRDGEPHVGTSVPLRLEPEGGGPPQQRYLDFVYQPIRNASGAVTGIFVQGYDISDRVNAEQRQALLVDEMNHRVKNTLATVQALAMLTGRSATTVAEFKTTLANRIAAMAKTQDLLVRGHAEPLPVEDVITSELAPYLGVGDQVRLTCEPMTIAPDAAVSLGLLVHELLTNAAKYGALASLDGKLDVRCHAGPAGATLVWREICQPKVRPVNSGGFGTLLIDRLARDLGGAAQIDIRDDGLEAMVIFSLSGRGHSQTIPAAPFQNDAAGVQDVH
jgi:two-component sensor histidine kinase